MQHLEITAYLFRMQLTKAVSCIGAKSQQAFIAGNRHCLIDAHKNLFWIQLAVIILEHKPSECCSKRAIEHSASDTKTSTL